MRGPSAASVATSPRLALPTHLNVVLVDAGGTNIGSVRYALQRLGVDAVMSADPERIRQATHVILPGVGAAGPGMQRLRKSGLDAVLRSLTQPVLGVCLGMQLLFEHSEEGDTSCLGLIPGCIQHFATRADDVALADGPAPSVYADVVAGIRADCAADHQAAPLVSLSSGAAGGEGRGEGASRSESRDNVATVKGTQLRIPHMGWNRLQVEHADPIFAGIDMQSAWAYFVHSYAAPVGPCTVVSSTHGKRFSAIVRRNNFVGMQFHPERSAALGAQLLANFLRCDSNSHV